MSANVPFKMLRRVNSAVTRHRTSAWRRWGWEESVLSCLRYALSCSTCSQVHYKWKRIHTPSTCFSVMHTHINHLIILFIWCRLNIDIQLIFFCGMLLLLILTLLFNHFLLMLIWMTLQYKCRFVWTCFLPKLIPPITEIVDADEWDLLAT